MKRLISSCLTLFTCCLLLLASERRAMAYVDPGTGLLAIQSAAASVAAAGYFLRKRIVGLFTKKKPATEVMPVVVRKDDSRKAA